MVFHKPFQVRPKMELRPTPSCYRRRAPWPHGTKVPNKIKVWAVQNSGRGVVARAYGFEDSPDAEVLTPGFNTGKESGAVGVGRHGNFLQWGFSAAPSKMTDAGRAFFLNCLCYISRFDGKAPLVRRHADHRIRAVEWAGKINARFSRGNEFLKKIIPPELLAKYKGKPDGLVRYFEQRYELIYYKRGPFLIDQELASLSIASNRRIETLQRLIELLGDKERAGLARKLLSRYTGRTPQGQQSWKKWLTENRDRIYFTDVGGYLFRVMPKGYLTIGDPPKLLSRQRD